jgi:hypothetical protein
MQKSKKGCRSLPRPRSQSATSIFDASQGTGYVVYRRSSICRTLTPALRLGTSQHFFHRIRLHRALRPYNAVRARIHVPVRVVAMGEAAVQRTLRLELRCDHGGTSRGWLEYEYMDEVKDPAYPRTWRQHPAELVSARSIAAP